MAEQENRAILQITYPDGQVHTLEIDTDKFELGRSPDSDFQLPDKKVSRAHTRVLFEEDQIWLVDLNSANGTFVGDEKLEPNDPYQLRFGETFSIGPYRLSMEEPAPATRQPEEDSMEAAQTDDEPEEQQAVQLGVEEFPGIPSPPEVGLDVEQEEMLQALDLFELESGQSSYLQYLPPIYGEHPFLGRYLKGFEAVWAPIEQTVDNFDFYLEAETTPDFFLEQLASWLGLSLDEKWPEKKRRSLIQEAGELYRWRGTKKGLRRHLEIYAEETPEIVEAKEQGNHFIVTLKVDEEAVDRRTLERIIEANKPAHTTYELNVE